MTQVNTDSSKITSNVYRVYDYTDPSKRTHAVEFVPRNEEEIHRGFFLKNKHDSDGRLLINPSLITLGSLNDYLLDGEENSPYFQQQQQIRKQRERPHGKERKTEARTRPGNTFDPRNNAHMHTKRQVHVLNHKKLGQQQMEWAVLRSPLDKDEHAILLEKNASAYNRQQQMYISDSNFYLNKVHSPTSRVSYAVPMEHPQIKMTDLDDPLDHIQSAHDLADEVRDHPFLRQRQQKEKVKKFHEQVKRRVAMRDQEKKKREKSHDNSEQESRDTPKSDEGSTFERQRIRKMKVHQYSQEVAARNQKLLQANAQQRPRIFRKYDPQSEESQRGTPPRPHSPPEMTLAPPPSPHSHLQQPNEISRTLTEPDAKLIDNTSTGSEEYDAAEIHSNHPEQMKVLMNPQRRTIRKRKTVLPADEYRQLEAKRYLEALREQVIYQCREMKLDIPALCNCGLDTFEDRSQCHMNCQFYNDSAAYARALKWILHSFGIET